MPASLDELRADRAALMRARRSGALVVGAGDKRITYRGIDEIKAALAQIDAEIAAQTARENGRPRVRALYLDTGKGV